MPNGRREHPPLVTPACQFRAGLDRVLGDVPMLGHVDVDGGLRLAPGIRAPASKEYVGWIVCQRVRES